LREAEILRDAGIQVVIVAETMAQKGSPAEGFSVVLIPTVKAGPWRAFRRHWRFFRVLLNIDVDYYHGHSPFLLMIVAGVTALLRRSGFIRDFNDLLVLQGTGVSVSYYEQEGLWGTDLSERERSRIAETFDMIPQGVSTILDVGCGDGRFTNQLVGQVERVMGVDGSEKALQYVQAEKCQASVDALPFADSTFELVVTTELLEHLPEEIYQRAIQELLRVAKKWILIGVPAQENLNLGKAWCARCGRRFHVNHHMRAFSRYELLNLFRGKAKCSAIREVGGKRNSYSWLLLWIRQHVAGIWARTPHTVCPGCGARLFNNGYPEVNAVRRFCDQRNARIQEKRGAGKSHFLALYRLRK
jgi:SAM-dependent methyltransferase